MGTLFFDHVTDFQTLYDRIGNRRYMGNLDVEDDNNNDDDDGNNNNM
jgi:hypothetical protein